MRIHKLCLRLRTYPRTTPAASGGPARPNCRRAFGPVLIGIGLSVAVLLASAMGVMASETAAPATEKTFSFPAAGLTFDAEFPGAHLDDCTPTGEGQYRVLIRPETTPINNSAWYAFRVRSAAPQTIEVELVYQGGGHRYRPKFSRDGKSWTALTGESYRQDKDRPPRLRLEVGPAPLWVAGQELLTSEDLYRWARQVATATEAAESVLGQSVGGRPLRMWRLGSDSHAPLVVIVGRQHPPEVTGSLALMAFVDTLAADSDTARRFRQHFALLLVPLMNPDGVESGNWRCNLNRVDLNRDWERFIQPETRAVRDEIQRLASTGQSPCLLLDFHSTGHDVFYTQRDSDQTVPEDFTRRWLGAVQERLPEYQLRREGSHGGKQATSKRWGYATYRIPAITYEVGDNTDRALIRTVARAAAAEMMRILLNDAADGRLSPTR